MLDLESWIFNLESTLMRVTIEKLAPTGEGIARTPEGVGFVAGALPGEQVEAQVEEIRKDFWKGRAAEIFVSSLQRVSGPHASCAGCDWAYFEPGAGLEAKRTLFLETMQRIGGQEPEIFGTLPAESSPPRYRLRNRFHVSGYGPAVAIGYLAPRTHRVEPLADCEAVSRETVALLPRIREALAAGAARATAVALLETPDSARRLARVSLEPGSGDAAARLAAELSPLFDGLLLEEEERGALSERGVSNLTISVAGRAFPVSIETFFQANRHLVDRLSHDVRDLARGISPGRALDAFGGSGLFAGALLDAGHSVTTVEGSHSAVRDAQRARSLWPEAERWNIVRSDVASFAVREPAGFDLAVVDPPRAGLGTELAGLLARRVRAAILYVSCEPATLARDLPAILASGFRVAAARLYDLFAGTHRIEAVVALEREGRS
jgi:23S rRNA (uracil1939-C5)-methyltransferase